MELFTTEQLVLLALMRGGVMPPRALLARIQAVTGYKATQGAFYAALRVGEERGYITRHAVIKGRAMRTSYELTPKGRDVIQEFIKNVSAFITR